MKPLSPTPKTILEYKVVYNRLSYVTIFSLIIGLQCVQRANALCTHCRPVTGTLVLTVTQLHLVTDSTVLYLHVAMYIIL